jgi:type I restriction enzyme, S subunit
MQERRTALISAVTGKIDVRHWHPPVVSKLETTPFATA